MDCQRRLAGSGANLNPEWHYFSRGSKTVCLFYGDIGSNVEFVCLEAAGCSPSELLFICKVRYSILAPKWFR